MIDPVRNRLADADGDAGNLIEPPAKIVQDLLAAALGFAQLGIDLRVMNALGVFIQFGATGAAADHDDLRHLHDDAFGERRDAVRFGERSARRDEDIDREAAFVKRRQELAAEERNRRHRGEHDDGEGAERPGSIC